MTHSWFCLFCRTISPTFTSRLIQNSVDRGMLRLVTESGMDLFLKPHQAKIFGPTERKPTETFTWSNPIHRRHATWWVYHYQRVRTVLQTCKHETATSNHMLYNQNCNRQNGDKNLTLLADDQLLSKISLHNIYNPSQPNPEKKFVYS